MTAPQPLLTAVQAAIVANRHPSTVRTWVSRGMLKRAGVNRHGAFLYRHDDVVRCEQRVTGRRSPT